MNDIYLNKCFTMKIKNVNIRKNYSSFSLNEKDNIIQINHMSYDSDSGDCDSSSIIIEKNIYEKGIIELINSNSCFVDGINGKLKIIRNPDNTLTITIKTQSIEVTLMNVNYELY